MEEIILCINSKIEIVIYNVDVCTFIMVYYITMYTGMR